TGLRERRAVVPADPYLLTPDEVHSTDRRRTGSLPEPEAAVGAIRDVGADCDLVGVYAAGSSFSGFADSRGQRNWFETANFNLDWSFYLRTDKAAQNLYAGVDWSEEALTQKMAWSVQQLDVLHRESIDLAPGGYRTYLAPSAMREISDMLAWGGFGLKAHRTKYTPLLRMVTEGAALHPSVTITEDTAGGTAPYFQEQGFLRPDAVTLVDAGSYADWLVSPRSAREFGVATNGASAEELPTALHLHAGSLPTGEVIEQLGTGLFVGNLWYLNFSDRAACRTTGMTRFSTFWVEDGEIVAPVNVLRFDDTAYHLLGDKLVGLTDETELLLDSSSYGRRSTDSVRLPGALVEEMMFTL
ncbi:MAG: metallopeptidase TldD-related protein, partial [Acidimicrobiia bacterium]|nr:metallopeptidase TldD-related protein [Acidimicrobiia bacterium]